MLTPVKNLHLSWYGCDSSGSEQKADVIVLVKGFIEELGDTIMNLALMSFYSS